MELAKLFPTPVSISKLGRELTAEESDFLLGQEFDEGQINSKNYYVLNHPSMAKIKLFIMKNADDYLNAIYKPATPIKLRFTQSWTNKLYKGQGHQPHSHANSFISGVFYVKAKQSVDRINFINLTYRGLVPPVKEPTEFNIPYAEIPVQTGDLLLFPSGFLHCVNPLQHEGPRISMSFNLFPTSSMGRENTLTYLDFPT